MNRGSLTNRSPSEFFNLKLRYSTEREDISFNQILRCEGLTTLLLSVKIQPQISESKEFLRKEVFNEFEALYMIFI